MIAFRFYETYCGEGMQFVCQRRWKTTGLYQPVKRFLCFYIPWGCPIHDSNSMFYQSALQQKDAKTP